jgi:hypothetical protein
MQHTIESIYLLAGVKGVALRTHSMIAGRRILARRSDSHTIAIVMQAGHPVGKSLQRLAKKALKAAAKSQAQAQAA